MSGAGVRRLARAALPAGVHARLVRTVQVLRLGSTWRDRRLLAGLLRERGAPTAPIAVRLRPLGGAALQLRPGTSDAQVVIDTFSAQYHMPAAGLLDTAPRTVLDLGANIGATLAHMAVAYPRAELLGVELDPGNALLAKANIAPWGDRCTLLEGAVWPRPGRLRYDSEPGDEWGAHVLGDASGPGPTAQALTMEELLDRLPDGRADLVKMDIEGAEREVLRQEAAWAPRVRCLMVEVHEPYTVPEALADLRELGFHATADDRHWAAVIGRRTVPGASPEAA